MVVNPGDVAPSVCTRVGNFPFSILEDKGDEGGVRSKFSIAGTSRKMPLVSKKEDYKNIFIDEGKLTVCNLNFCIPLMPFIVHIITEKWRYKVTISNFTLYETESFGALCFGEMSRFQLIDLIVKISEEIGAFSFDNTDTEYVEDISDPAYTLPVICGECCVCDPALTARVDLIINYDSETMNPDYLAREGIPPWEVIVGTITLTIIGPNGEISASGDLWAGYGGPASSIILSYPAWICAGVGPSTVYQQGASSVHFSAGSEKIAE